LKAILLAGGYGTRGRPFTDYLPKAMIPLDGRPVIDHIIRYLAKFPEISDFIVVCEFDRFGKQIINYFDGKETLIGKSITFIQDKKNGTGGALLNIEKNVMDDDTSKDDEACFLVWFADNLCALKIDDMVRNFKMIDSYLQSRGEKGGKKENGVIIGMVAVRSKRFEETGRVVLEKKEDCYIGKNDDGYDNDNNGSSNISNISVIKEFIEKGVTKLDRPEAIGIYLFSKRVFDYLHIKSKEYEEDNDHLV
jgi:mannose-1-phosphate guanylyltransferase